MKLCLMPDSRLGKSGLGWGWLHACIYTLKCYLLTLILQSDFNLWFLWKIKFHFIWTILARDGDCMIWMLRIECQTLGQEKVLILICRKIDYLDRWTDCVIWGITWLSMRVSCSSPTHFACREAAAAADMHKLCRHETFPDFSGIPDFQSSYILIDMYRSQSQLSVELWILKIGPDLYISIKICFRILCTEYNTRLATYYILL